MLTIIELIIPAKAGIHVYHEHPLSNGYSAFAEYDENGGTKQNNDKET